MQWHTIGINYLVVTIILHIPFSTAAVQRHTIEIQRGGKSTLFTTKPLSANLGPDPSIKFAEFNEDGQMHLGSKALEVLASIKKPVACLTICGPYRSGKSYYLSRVLGIKNAFSVSSISDPCTMGIWMSTQVLDCGEFVVLLFDTEGTDAADQSTGGDVNKFITLSTLMSSYLVFNTKGCIRKADLDGMR